MMDNHPKVIYYAKTKAEVLCSICTLTIDDYDLDYSSGSMSNPLLCGSCKSTDYRLDSDEDSNPFNSFQVTGIRVSF